MTQKFEPGRRSLLLGSGAAVAAAFGGPLTAMAKRVEYRDGAACVAAPASSVVDSPYGPTAPVNDLTTGLPLVELPVGFRYASYGWTGDQMADGLITPAAHDGMGIVSERRVGVGHEIILVRNHELSGSNDPTSIIGFGRDVGPGAVAKHDAGKTGNSYQRGGTTTLVWRNNQWVDSYASFGGLIRPCAGGSSTWGSWLSNEETLSNNISDAGKKHGYIFEVRADTSLIAANPNPIVAMGRFNHEASAIDPATGYWYLTEDQGNANTLYRFLPNNIQGGLNSLHAGGSLQGLAVKGARNRDLRNPALCDEFVCEWVNVANPDADALIRMGGMGGLEVVGVGTVTASGPYAQAYAEGAAIFGANEGCWVADGIVYFTDKQVTSAPARAGRIWALHLASMTLKAVFVSDDKQVGNSPDNVCITPRGGVLFCEDGGPGSPNPTGAPIISQRLMGVTAKGQSYVFAKHNFNFTRSQLEGAGKLAVAPAAVEGQDPRRDNRNTEWAGAVFSSDGHTLFVNLYTPGITLAIQGPWARGTL